MKRLLLLLVVLFGVWMCWKPPPKARWSGRPVTAVVQTGENLPRPWVSGGKTVTPLARFAVTAVVLSRERYRFDPDAKLAPVDLALGWGPMSEAATLNALSISQGHRWYHYSWSGAPPLPLDEIRRWSANMHLIPANAQVRAELLQVRRHEVVIFSGYLVELRDPTGWHWRSSTSREDSEGGACEVVWVEQLERRSL